MWRFVRPELEELIVYVSAIIVLLGIAFYQVAVQGQIGIDSQGVVSMLDASRETFLSFLSQDDSWGRFFLFGVWFIIGTVVYMLAWATITIIADLRRDIKVSSSFVHPQSFHQSNYWHAILLRGTLRLASGIALIFYGVFWIVGLAPVWIDTFANLLVAGISFEYVVQALLAVVSIVVTLHIGLILLRVMLLRSEYS